MMASRDLPGIARAALRALKEDRPLFVTPDEYRVFNNLIIDDPAAWDSAVAGVLRSDYGSLWLPFPGRNVSVVVTDIDAMIEPPQQPSFVCPRCGSRSFSPTDAKEGYCGKCHAFTAGWRG
jgi:hypothetical protein